jgi:hypothetical protein
VGREAAEFEEARHRVARENAARAKKHRAKMRRFRYQPRSGARDDEALSAARKARESLHTRLRRKGGRATDEDRAAARAADERVATEIVECKRRRAQARADLAIDRAHFPSITKRFADAHPEAAAKIREISRLHRLVRKRGYHRCHDHEHQDQLMARREALLREAWDVALAVAGTAGTAATA